MTNVQPDFKVFEIPKTIEDSMKIVELAGRNCYKSEGKITDKSYIEFVQRMRSSNHTSVLEHGTIYLKIHCNDYIKPFESIAEETLHTKFYKIKYSHPYYYITINYADYLRHPSYNGKFHELKEFICMPTIWHPLRISAIVTMPISCSREWNRHRIFSISEQSTRYCNYASDRFDKKINFCVPENTFEEEIEEDVMNFLKKAEKEYFKLINKGVTPQHAREVLPLCTKTTAVYTAFYDDWCDFFDKRLTPASHPTIFNIVKDLAEEIHDMEYNFRRKQPTE